MVQPSPFYRCPRCHRGRIFKGLISVVDQCSECGLSLKKHEQGDGPAFFGIVIVGTLVAIFATIVEVKFAPALWLHAVIWVPFIFIGSIASLRLGKAMLIHMQFRVRNHDFK